MYVGYRPILPGQNSNEWRHNVTGEKGVYSNWQLQSSTHLLDGAPLNDHVPGTGRHPHGLRLSQQFTGAFRYAPMELSKYSHGGQSAAYLRHEGFLFHGVPGADVFPAGYGHDGTREFTFSRFINRGQLGVPSSFRMEDPGHVKRGYGEGIAWHGPTESYIYQGVGDDKLEDPGQTQAEKEGRYGFERVREHHGVPSSKAL